MNTEFSTKDNTLTEYLKNYRIKIGESIREIREKRGYNQEQLAEIMKAVNLILVWTIFQSFHGSYSLILK